MQKQSVFCTSIGPDVTSDTPFLPKYALPAIISAVILVLLILFIIGLMCLGVCCCRSSKKET